jgi:hypothetical protein
MVNELNFFKLLFYFIAVLNYSIYCKYNSKITGQLCLNKNGNLFNIYNIFLHPILNYPYLLKYNMTLFQHNNNTFININNISSNDINGSNTIDYFYLHFLDNEESIINLVLNKTIDSIVSYNYLIITSSNISKTIVESLLYQIFYMNQSDYISLIELISKNYEKLDKKQEKVSINLYIDNTNELIPYKYIYYSKYIPLIIILLLLIFNRFFFKRNVYYNLCFKI